jgi:hypothetical protein
LDRVKIFRFRQQVANPFTGTAMLRLHSPFEGKRYIGDNRLRVYHDAVHELRSENPDSCRIDHIPEEEIRTFSPDTAAEARRCGFVQCPYCRLAETKAHE